MSQLEDLLQQCTVKLSLPGRMGWGTGFFVASELILTCAHVVQEAKGQPVQVQWQKRELEAVVERSLPEPHDLALLRVAFLTDSNPPCVYLDEEIRSRDPLYLFGYPDQDFPNGCPVTFICEGLTGDDPALIKFALGQVRPGMSGSPLLNQRTGKVCGIVKFTRDRSFDLGGGAVPVSAILQHFRTLAQQQQTFHQHDERWSSLLSTLEVSQSRVWMVPANRNPFFTGRETLLAEMRACLMTGYPTALCGLGGMGKTQTSIEYAYRHQKDYKAVLWVRAEQAREFSSGLVEVAKVLELPIAQERDETLIISAVKAWLKQHQNWLLVLDNVDDLTVVRTFLQGINTGHVLSTSRAQSTGAIKRLEIQRMATEEGALFLLRRAKLIEEQAEWSAALAEAQALAVRIVTQMDGLPLALDQAGAFIEETFISLEDYLAFYEAEGVKLLAERGELADDHPSVTVTFSLAFDKVMGRSLAAADLLRACAFLAPDAIPEELFREAATELGDHLSALSEQPLELTKVLAEASRFSLLYRNGANRTFSIHRLVQQVLRAKMGPDECRVWAERIVRSLNRIFPEPDYPNWPLCDRLLPHIRVTTAFVKTYQLQFEAASELLDKTGNYLRERGEYAEAESLLQTALALKQQLLGQEHPNVATSLNDLAMLYRKQGRYTEAEPLYLQSLALNKKLLGEEHPSFIANLDNLAGLYTFQMRYEEAEPLILRALELRKNIFGEGHRDTLTSLNNLAYLYYCQGRCNEAEPLYLEVLALEQHVFGEEHPDVAITLHNLAMLYKTQDRHNEAEQLYLQGLELKQRTLGKDHPDIAISFNHLANLYRDQGRCGEAEPLYQQALTIWKQKLGNNHPQTALGFDNLATLYRDQRQYTTAELLYRKALTIWKQAWGENSPYVGRCLDRLAKLHVLQGHDQVADTLFSEALEILEQELGVTDPWTVRCRENLEQLRNRSS